VYLCWVLSELGHEVIVAHARNVRLIGESRKKDDRLDARTLARLARIDPQLLAPVKHRSAEAQAHLMASDGDSSLSGLGPGADVADQHGAGTDEVLWGAVAGLQSTEHESGEGAGVESRNDSTIPAQ